MAKEKRPDPKVAALAFSEAQRTLEGQEAALNQLHSRSATLLAASAVATSFLAGVAITNRAGSLSGFAVAGVVLAAIVVVLTLFVIAPRKGWTWRASGSRILDLYYDGEHEPLRIEDIHVKLARRFAEAHKANQKTITLLHRVFAWAVAAVGVEITAWLIDLLFFYSQTSIDSGGTIP